MSARAPAAMNNYRDNRQDTCPHAGRAHTGHSASQKSEDIQWNREHIHSMVVNYHNILQQTMV